MTPDAPLDPPPEPRNHASLHARSIGRSSDATKGPLDRPAIEEAIEEAELGHAPDDIPSAPTALRDRVQTILAISFGAALGANLRYLAGRWATDVWGSAFPWGTLLINVTGSFVIGLYLTTITERRRGRAVTRLFFVTGFLGAYTTFSTFSFDNVQLLQDGRVVRAGCYIIASVALGLAGVAAGASVARLAPIPSFRMPRRR